MAIDVSYDHFSKFQQKMIILNNETKNSHIQDYKCLNELYIF